MTIIRVRRQPPQFRRVEVRHVRYESPRLARVTMSGPELAGFVAPGPAASVRLLLPTGGDLTIPEWDGNEFLLPDGTRPVIRTLTPWRLEEIDNVLELDVGIVLHGDGALSQWAQDVSPGAVVAVSGPGRGYDVDQTAPAYLVAGDETALPAITQVVGALPHDRPVAVHIEAASDEARIALPDHPGATVTWWDAPAGAPSRLIEAVTDADLLAGTRLWVAGEAAAVQRVRRHLFDEREWPRSLATVRGYWKRGLAAAEDGGA